MSFFQNLWRDLVDKRLWPVAVALVLAAVAVPFLIDTGSAEPVAASEPNSAAAAAAAANAAVAGQVAVAVTPDDQQRARAGKSRDPFKPLVYAKVKKTEAAGTGTAGTTTTGTSASGSATAGTGSSGSAATGGKTDTGTSTTTPATPTTPATTTTTKTRLLGYALSVQIKRSGRIFSRHGVRPITYLPSASNALVAFLGVKSDGETATFLVSDRVNVLNQNVVCRPSRTNCRLAEVKAGENLLVARTPAVGQPIKRFRIVVTKIGLRAVPKKKPASTSSTRTTRAASAPGDELPLAIDLAPARQVDITRTSR